MTMAVVIVAVMRAMAGLIVSCRTTLAGRIRLPMRVLGMSGVVIGHDGPLQVALT